MVAVLKATTFSQALEIANDTNFALTGGLYSRTPSHIEQAKAAFEVGNLYINRTITGAIVSRQPFGGFKLSRSGFQGGWPGLPGAVPGTPRDHGKYPAAGICLD